jgi:hypothetical protein
MPSTLVRWNGRTPRRARGGNPAHRPAVTGPCAATAIPRRSPRWCVPSLTHRRWRRRRRPGSRGSSAAPPGRWYWRSWRSARQDRHSHSEMRCSRQWAMTPHVRCGRTPDSPSNRPHPRPPRPRQPARCWRRRPPRWRRLVPRSRSTARIQRHRPERSPTISEPPPRRVERHPATRRRTAPHRTAPRRATPRRLALRRASPHRRAPTTTTTTTTTTMTTRRAPVATVRETAVTIPTIPTIPTIRTTDAAERVRSGRDVRSPRSRLGFDHSRRAWRTRS